MYVIALRLPPVSSSRGKYPNTIELAKMINETYQHPSQKELPAHRQGTKFDPDKLYSLGELATWMLVLGNSVEEVEAAEIKNIQKEKGFERGKKQQVVQEKIQSLMTKDRENFQNIHDKIVPGFVKEYSERLKELEKSDPQ